MKWLKLKLLSETSLDSTLVMLQELMQRYSYALDRGFTLEFYKKVNSDSEAPDLILKTDHPLFLHACMRHFNDFVRFYIPSKNFKIPEGFVPGHKHSSANNSDVA